MTTPTIEEMVETACHAWAAGLPMTVRARAAMRMSILAVIEKHFEPMIGEAYADALYEVTDWDARKRTKEAVSYAARILAHLKGQSK